MRDNIMRLQLRQICVMIICSSPEACDDYARFAPVVAPNHFVHACRVKSRL